MRAQRAFGSTMPSRRRWACTGWGCWRYVFAWRSPGVTSSRPAATPTMRWRSPRKPTSGPPTSSSALRPSPTIRVITAKRPGCSLGGGHPGSHRRGPLQDLRRRLHRGGWGAASRNGHRGLRGGLGRGPRPVHRRGDRRRPARVRDGRPTHDEVESAALKAATVRSFIKLPGPGGGHLSASSPRSKTPPARRRLAIVRPC